MYCVLLLLDEVVEVLLEVELVEIFETHNSSLTSIL